MTTQRTAGPRTRPRVDGYIRISRVAGREGEHFISPIVQREEIGAWVRRHGAELVEMLEELDESGRRKDRPQLLRAIERIELGITDGLVVPTVDRFGRNQLDGLSLIKRVLDAGGHLYSAREDFDLSDPVGRYLCRELLSIAEFQSDRLGIGWQQAKDKMIARGAYPASQVPFGYRRARSGRLTPDTKLGPHVTELFRLRAQGASLHTLCRYLETAGVKSAHGNLGWSRQSLRQILANRAYLGELHWGSIARFDTHPPLTDGATWQRAQRPPLLSRERASRRAPALLTGLVRCAGCSMSLVPALNGRPGQRHEIYCCHGRSAGGPCPARAYIQAALLEAYVVGEAFVLLRRQRTRRPTAVTTAETRTSRAERALRSYRDSRDLGAHLDAQMFADGLRRRDQRLAEARLALALARQADDLDDLPAAHVLERQWPTLPLQARREILARLIDCAFVGRGRLPVVDRVTVCPLGTAPADLPRTGNRRSHARPFRPRDAGTGTRRIGTRGAHRWSNARLEDELLEFLAQRQHWPIADGFIRAGRGELLQQARLRASDQWWAFHFQLPLQRPPRHHHQWTDDAIRADLSDYLASKEVWPTVNEFIRAGHGSLRKAIEQTGGLTRWAAEFPRVACPQARRWTDETIRAALDPLCSGRTTFPTQRELARNGYSGLNHVLARRGRAWWAEQYHLPLSPMARAKRPRDDDKSSQPSRNQETR